MRTTLTLDPDVESKVRTVANPHRASYLFLVQELGDRLLQLQREWLDDVERVLRPGG